jgi:hypothetical protein
MSAAERAADQWGEELRKRAGQARAKGQMRAVALWPDEADHLAGLLDRCLDQFPRWIPAATRYPDSDIDVLLAMPDGDVIAGFYDDEIGSFRNGEAFPVEGVTHWSHFMAPPETVPA